MNPTKSWFTSLLAIAIALIATFSVSNILAQDKKPNILFRKILCYLALDVVFALARWGIGGQAKRIISDGARHMVKYLVN